MLDGIAQFHHFGQHHGVIGPTANRLMCRAIGGMRVFFGKARHIAAPVLIERGPPAQLAGMAMPLAHQLRVEPHRAGLPRAHRERPRDDEIRPRLPRECELVGVGCPSLREVGEDHPAFRRDRYLREQVHCGTRAIRLPPQDYQ